MTPEILAACTGARIDRARTHAPFITQAMDEYAITSPTRQAAFLAQIGHESGGLHWSEELWGIVATLAQARYEPPSDLAVRLGNVQPGDGVRFKGRGWVQVTGRENYRKCGEALGVDLEADPAQLALPGLAARSAGWYWSSRGLNELADDDSEASFLVITKRINGGLNGLDDRQRLWAAAKTALGIT